MWCEKMNKKVMNFFPHNNSFISNPEKAANVILQYLKVNPNFKWIVVSVCSGRSQKEVHSDDLCLRLDKEKWSLFATSFASKYFHRSKNNIVYCHQKMENGLLNILCSFHILLCSISCSIPAPLSCIKF